MAESRDDEVILFLAKADGTVDCTWCGENFNADLAVPDANDEPICPQCAEMAEQEYREEQRLYEQGLQDEREAGDV